MIRTEDLTVGWYQAHDSGVADCEIRKIERLDEHTLEITYVYESDLRTKPYSNSMEWNVKHYFSIFGEYVIEELGVLL